MAEVALFYHQTNPVFAVTWADDTQRTYLFDLGAIVGKITWPASMIELPPGVIVGPYVEAVQQPI